MQPRGSIGRALGPLIAAALVLAACSPQGDPTTTVGIGEPATPSAAAGATTTTTTAAAAEPVALPAGVVWQGTTVDATPGAGASSLIATDAGFVAAGNRTRPQPDPQFGQSSQPVVYASPDAVTWTTAELPVPNDRTYAADVAVGPAGLVAVGTVGTGCRFACPNGYSVAWVSTDGDTWELVEPDTFRGSVRVSVSDIAVLGDTYVAVGSDERGGDRWVLGVWTSPDGRSWQRVATLEDDYSLAFEALFVVGDRLFISADEAVCSEPFPNGDFGFVLGTWATETHLWSSADGIAWEPVDVAAAGLSEPLLPEVCEDNAYLGAETDDRSAAVTAAIGDELWWRRHDGTTAVWDGSTWAPVALPEAVAALSLLAAPDGYLALGAVGLETGVIDFTAMASTDRVTWDDWTDHTKRVVGLVPPGSQASVSISRFSSRHSVVRGNTVVVMVLATRREPMTTAYLGLFAIASTPVVEGAPCTPAAGADCRSADLADVDMTGADLHGIDLTGADLSGATLDGVDLSGATLVGADLGDAELRGVTLTGADLSHASLDYATLAASDLSGARLSYASLTGLELDAATIVTGTDFTNAFSLPLDLAAREAVLAAPDFDWWRGGPLDLSGVHLADSSLSGDLTGFDFTGADLTNASFVLVTAVDADFTEAVLTGADLGSTDFTGARFAGAQVDGVVSWSGATCPDGFELGYDTGVSCEGHYLDR